MNKLTFKIEHKFVEFIPDKLKDSTLYISIEHCTSIHLCACGCRNEVVTPISPTGWGLHFNGKTVTLSPSIGNYNFDCRSHYFIRENHIVYADERKDKSISKETLIIEKKRSWVSFLRFFFGFRK